MQTVTMSFFGPVGHLVAHAEHSLEPGIDEIDDGPGRTRVSTGCGPSPDAPGGPWTHAYDDGVDWGASSISVSRQDGVDGLDGDSAAHAPPPGRAGANDHGVEIGLEAGARLFVGALHALLELFAPLTKALTDPNAEEPVGKI